MTNFDILDETWAQFGGLLRVLRKGNGFEWQVYGPNNYDIPLMTGTAGNFFDAQREGEKRLYKDLREIFYLLNEVSQKERREGEPEHTELIEQAIRYINAGDKEKAMTFLNQIIQAEIAEHEPDDASMLALARNMLREEEMEEKTQGGGEPAQSGIQRPEKEAEKDTGVIAPPGPHPHLRGTRHGSMTSTSTGGVGTTTSTSTGSGSGAKVKVVEAEKEHSHHWPPGNENEDSCNVAAPKVKKNERKVAV